MKKIRIITAGLLAFTLKEKLSQKLVTAYLKSADFVISKNSSYVL